MNGGNGVVYTPGGLAYAGADGQLRNAANAALLALAYARLRNDYRGIQIACWARGQVHDLAIHAVMLHLHNSKSGWIDNLSASLLRTKC